MLLLMLKNISFIGISAAFERFTNKYIWLKINFKNELSRLKSKKFITDIDGTNVLLLL